ncbi:hypothetical protein ACIA5D_37640 [Actinoplanes sp. NPDC051513]|uniref:hypothetical protein n=1 Tax=Actinoplanes sp. NPDC051513 TaxID=3363908 RepID=UPI00378B8CBD
MRRLVEVDLPHHAEQQFLPLDVLYHQGDNIDRERLRRLTRAPAPSGTPGERPPLHSWLVRWIERDSDPRTELDSLPGVLLHLADAWRRREERNVRLVHYDDLLTDLDGQMRHIAAWLAIDVPAGRWPEELSRYHRRVADLAPPDLLAWLHRR